MSSAQTATFVGSQRWDRNPGIDVMINDAAFHLTDRQANHVARTIISNPWRAIQVNESTVRSVTDHVRQGGPMAVEDVVRAFQFNTPGCVLKALAAAVQDGILAVDAEGYVMAAGRKGGCGDD